MISPETNSVIDRAKRVYAERLQADLEAEHRDRFVAIEPESGDYFLGDVPAARNDAAKRDVPGSQ